MPHILALDTLKYTKRLEDASIPRSQAEAQAAALSEALDSSLGELATKGDFREFKTEVRGEFKLIKWMLAIIIAVNVLPVLQTLFGI